MERQPIGAPVTPHPRILVVFREHWPRSLVRAELLEAGFDAVGAPSLAAALLYRADEKGRGPVRVVLLDETALTERDRGLLEHLRQRHRNPAVVLIARGPVEDRPGTWAKILHRPVRIGEAVAVVRELLR
jgi:DNA-binding response OmpR family regulator